MLEKVPVKTSILSQVFVYGSLYAVKLRIYSGTMSSETPVGASFIVLIPA